MRKLWKDISGGMRIFTSKNGNYSYFFSLFARKKIKL